MLLFLSVWMNVGNSRSGVLKKKKKKRSFFVLGIAAGGACSEQSVKNTSGSLLWRESGRFMIRASFVWVLGSKHKYS